MKHVTPDIQSWLSGELSQQETSRFQAHLDQCPECTREAAEARKFWDGLDVVDIPAAASSLWPEVRRKTFGQDEKTFSFFGTGRVIQTSLATAAMAAGLMIGILLPGGSGPTVGGEVEAMDSGVAQLETVWLSGSSWGSDFTDLATGWLIAGQADEQTEAETISGEAQ